MFALIIKSMFSSQALTELYERRKALHPSEENRTPVNVTIAFLLFALTLGFLLAVAWLRQDADSYISQRTHISLEKDLMSGWLVTPPKSKDCAMIESCYEEILSDEKMGWTPFHLANDPLQVQSSSQIGQKTIVIVRRQIPASSWENMANYAERLVWSFPAANYYQADVFVNGRHHSSHNDSERVAFSFNPTEWSEPTHQLDIVFVLDQKNTSPVIDLRRPHLNLIEKNLTLMTLPENRAFEEFIVADKAGRGNFIGTIARIVMAVFVLALFLIIDGSPETLALSLFLGFEAFAITLSFGWLPIESAEFFKHFSYQMGDIFRLVFFLQLARIIDKDIRKWLVWGTLLSIPYGILRLYEVRLQIPLLHYIPEMRDILVGFIGTIVCARSAFYLRNKNLPWRVIALCIAAIASFEQIVDPLSHHITSLNLIPGFTTVIDIMQPFSAWLLAFSAFINISTLENRVKTLSKIKARANAIEEEMRLAETVQKAFLTLPKLPTDISLVCHHEAMLYVSGDTYFADWNKQHKKLTFLINDVTGHGVQAALKASGVTVIANTIWSAASAKIWQNNKIRQYAEMVEEFYSRMSDNPDIVAMGGGEFDLQTGQVKLFRKNFPFPILIHPREQDGLDAEARKSDNWVVRMLTIPNNTETVINLSPRSFIVFASDGFVDNSRMALAFMRFLRKNLGTQPSNLSSMTIKSLVLECKSFRTDSLNDDRTLTVFQWIPDVEEKIENIPGSGSLVA